MYIIGGLFLGCISITLMFAGIAKISSYKNTINTIMNMGIFPDNLSKVMGTGMPIFEIITSVSLILTFSKINVILILAYLIFFIGLNLKFIIERRSIKCCCYGKFIKSNLGKAGFLHYIYLLILLLFGYLCMNDNIINTLKVLSNFQIIIEISLMFVFVLNGFLLRSLVDKYGIRRG